MNRLRQLFQITQEEVEQSFNRIEQKLKDDKHCMFCVHAVEQPHYEMGYNCGSDVYCTKLHELRLTYPTGDQCLFWELKGDYSKTNL